MPGEAAEIRFDHATKRYAGGTVAVDDLTMTVPAGTICVLVGPSGGGKTTAMKMVNRLVEISDGDVLLGGTSVRDLDATTLRRSIGYVIQHAGLFPHMTVGENVSTVPRLLGWPRRRVADRVREMIDLVGLAPGYASRYPSQLSGGERQRVGLARALAADPAVALMDEPFGALDPITRARLQEELLRLHQAIRKTVIFVTHDIDEAVLMGDRIAVLEPGGRLAQYDTPDRVLAEPASPFVASFVGADRGLKRLALATLETIELEPLRPTPRELPVLPSTTSLRDALSAMLAEGTRELVVCDASGVPLGIVGLDALAAGMSR